MRLIILIVLIFQTHLHGDVIEGIDLKEVIPELKITDDIDLPRQTDLMSIKDIIKKSDNFLKENFGQHFKPAIFGVSLQKRYRPNGVMWCWSVVYHYPQSDKKNKNRLFKITLSLKGEVLMQVEKIRQGSKAQKEGM